MTEWQIRLVKRSWSIFRKIDAALVADVFYSRLFSLKPSLRRMFPDNMTDQYQKLIRMIHHVVIHLDRMHVVHEDIRVMADRHVRYGAKKSDYALVGAALVWTLEKGLGKDWSDELREAWQACYGELALLMTTERSETTGNLDGGIAA